MTQRFTGNVLTSQDVERIRLVLSTYQDGTGMLESKGKTLPGWRDFERATAIALYGVAQESKAVYDVLVAIDDKTSFGISCKMRGELRKVRNQGRASLEISNSAKKFWDALNKVGITVENYKQASASTIGKTLCCLIESWHEAVSIGIGGTVDLSKSYYLSLSWDKHERTYQLDQFDNRLPNPEELKWDFPENNGKLGKRLRGMADNKTVIEWYGESGGQFKYYPKISDGLWSSGEFRLEPLPDGMYGVEKKAEIYFPDKWKATKI
ncbi:MAG: hypothetical protein PHU14_16175 [Methylovulum sp.]|nr:hypothetical protein [Methylovulum sp.]